jgi:hypothetical protein
MVKVSMVYLRGDSLVIVFLIRVVFAATKHFAKVAVRKVLSYQKGSIGSF